MVNPLHIDPETGGLALSDKGRNIVLHPLWIRERVRGENIYSPLSNQRLYEPAEFPADLTITDIASQDDNVAILEFSDGTQFELPVPEVLKEIGVIDDPEAPPIPESWTTALNSRPKAKWSDLDDPAKLKQMLEGFLRYGFCIIEGTPTERDVLIKLAGRFGYVRDTHWGKIFNVEKKANATDTAYTDLPLPSHTDNPYREPVPGIQFLHCLANEVSGGLSTLVDGIAITERLALESPEKAALLETINVRFRYHGPAAILETHAPMVERDHRGIVKRIRHSSRLDYVPAMEKETLDMFYAARKRLNELSNDPEFRITFPFKKGTLLMMDNYRLLHGRTAFDGDTGRRHLQGCYTDHDGVTSLYRMLANGSQITAVPTEA